MLTFLGILFWFRLFDRSLSDDRLGCSIVKVKATFYAIEESRLTIYQNTLHLLGIESLTMQMFLLRVRASLFYISSELHAQLGKFFYELLSIAIIGNIKATITISVL